MALKTLPKRLAPAPASRIAFLDATGGGHKRHYQSSAHDAWAAAVKARDGYTCQQCGAFGRGVRLVADHIKEALDGGELLALSNGRTLCIACHNAKTARARAARLGR